MMMLQLQTESRHLIFRASSAFERGELRSKGHGKKSIHFNGSEENIVLLLRTVFSANQLNFYGAIADLCKELSEDSESWRKPEALDQLETMEIRAGTPYQRTATGKLGARLWAQIRTNVWWPEVIQTMLWRWFENCRKRTTLLHTLYRRRSKDATFMPRIHDASMRKEDSSERMDSQEYEDRSSLGHKKLSPRRSIQWWSSGWISVSRPHSLLVSNRERNWQRDRIDANQGGRA